MIAQLRDMEDKDTEFYDKVLESLPVYESDCFINAVEFENSL